MIKLARCSEVITLLWVGPSPSENIAKLQARKDLQLLGQAHDRAEAIHLVHASQPRVVLLDAAGLATDAFQLTAAIHRKLPRCAVLALGDELAAAEAEQLLSVGARGFLRRDATMRSYVKAIHCVHSGHIFFPPKLMGLLLERFLARLQSEVDLAHEVKTLLTQREHDIMNYTQQGMTNKQIARRLSISDKTVKTHLQRIYKKLHVSRRGQLAHREVGGDGVP